MRAESDLATLSPGGNELAVRVAAREKKKKKKISGHLYSVKPREAPKHAVYRRFCPRR